MVQAIIMAGGEGSRLRPLTCDRPKPMVPMLNRPVMEHAVDLLKKNGISDIGVTLQYMPQEITNHFGDGSDFGVNMQFFIEDSPLGTAGSVRNAAGFINETFVVVSGDALTDFDLSEAIRFHRDKGAVATLVLTPVEIPLEYGVVITEKSGEIRRFLEKPGWGEVFSDTVNTGIYILEPDVLQYIPQGSKFDFSKDLFPYLLQEKKPLFGITLSGYWCDIGNLKQYQEAHYTALEGRVAVNLREKPHGHGIYTGEGSLIEKTAVIIPPVVIGSNCHIGSGAHIGPHVVLGDNCKVDDGASLKSSVVWNGSYIGKHAEIRGAVLCNRVTVQDRAMVFEGSVVGDKSILEENTRIRPDTKIWPYKIIERDTAVDSHLVWGTKACRNLFGADGVMGKVNVNLIPECAAKLGAVFGTILGPEASVLITADHHCSAEMIKSAVQSGLMSAGINVIDGGSVITPVHSHSVRCLQAKGGIHIKSSAAEPEMLHINFFSETGAVINRDVERKIENLFERDDFQRRPKQKTGKVSYVPGLTDSYAQFLYNLVDRDKVRQRRFKILAYYTGPNLRAIIPQTFNGLGCDLINTAVEVEKESFFDIRAVAEALAGEVPKAGADLGLVLDANGEHAVLIDEQGKIIDDDLFMALISLVILDTAREPVVAVPVNATQAIDKMAEVRKGRVVRTKTAPVAFMQEVLRLEMRDAQGPFNQAVLAADALAAVIRVLEYAALKETSLSRMTAGIPEFHMVRKQTDCPWREKGRVIRQLIEENRGKPMELIDGVKVYHDKGWALVLPDAGEPRYHVFSEGSTYEFAEELANFYVNRIKELRNGSE